MDCTYRYLWAWSHQMDVRKYKINTEDNSAEWWTFIESEVWSQVLLVNEDPQVVVRIG